MERELFEAIRDECGGFKDVETNVKVNASKVVRDVAIMLAKIFISAKHAYFKILLIVESPSDLVPKPSCKRYGKDDEGICYGLIEADEWTSLRNGRYGPVRREKQASPQRNRFKIHKSKQADPSTGPHTNDAGIGPVQGSIQPSSHRFRPTWVEKGKWLETETSGPSCGPEIRVRDSGEHYLQRTIGSHSKGVQLHEEATVMEAARSRNPGLRGIDYSKEEQENKSTGGLVITYYRRNRICLIRRRVYWCTGEDFNVV
ncbi:hypothetical protein F0562_025706 [Nyssa sinensis]|uniref:Uncharacterized protein n=1 Tax=Nyssa sinensis TaxID=561372 RepID=A0A5J5B8S1_9ASTE|nr:hypothetical protein F0562_025706 [Nyssa sinensis]